VWSYALRQHLRVDPKEHPFMLSEPTFQPAADREKMLQLMFEKFETPASFLCKSAVLTAFSAGRSTACVLESGAGHTTVSPIHDGYVVSKGVRRSQMAGAKLDDVLEKILKQAERPVTLTPAVRTTCNRMQLRQNWLGLAIRLTVFYSCFRLCTVLACCAVFVAKAIRLRRPIAHQPFELPPHSSLVPRVPSGRIGS
jgi:hypothetical protein